MFLSDAKKCLQNVHSLSLAAKIKSCYYYVGRLSETEMRDVKKAFKAV